MLLIVRSAALLFIDDMHRPTQLHEGASSHSMDGCNSRWPLWDRLRHNSHSHRRSLRSGPCMHTAPTGRPHWYNVATSVTSCDRLTIDIGLDRPGAATVMKFCGGDVLWTGCQLAFVEVFHGLIDIGHDWVMQSLPTAVGFVLKPFSVSKTP